MPNDDRRQSELRSFDNTKAGVKGLVDGGAFVIPQIFVHPPHHLDGITAKSCLSQQVPVIDLDGFNKDPQRHKAILEEILRASRTWGFFQVVNHGISTSTLEATLDGVRRFHEQDVETKKKYYTRDYTRKMLYNSNHDLYTSPAVCWRDSFNVIVEPGPLEPEELPEVCRDILSRYSKEVIELGTNLFKLLSEALGLDPNHLIDIDCAQTLALFGHYYPACPEPEHTLGTRKHSDYSFLTILLQDNLGGLQVQHQGEWVNIVPLAGALVVNIGDLLQLVSNDKLRSVEHRVVVNRRGPRVSMAAFFGRDTVGVNSRSYGPIGELLSEENPPKYRATTIRGYTSYFHNKGGDGISPLKHLEL
ncbi:1-aminocyclopropane-1-carboxylate oxidase homolog 1-like [Andrographis paniculata]|uniref:1-aminocyclopropane-1-carboxylate oxidase homolog 1-like n=1 Tax=Andrographis paniculata TaxID=175694 RepID=UPI0021E8E6F4|nr:1-aminocyclopropane-1-carboxylate oxidase homolog 1-like [Andrographis paniculata]